jgi:hypothetical protein
MLVSSITNVKFQLDFTGTTQYVLSRNICDKPQKTLTCDTRMFVSVWKKLFFTLSINTQTSQSEKSKLYKIINEKLHTNSYYIMGLTCLAVW